MHPLSKSRKQYVVPDHTYMPKKTTKNMHVPKMRDYQLNSTRWTFCSDNHAVGSEGRVTGDLRLRGVIVGTSLENNKNKNFIFIILVTIRV